MDVRAKGAPATGVALIMVVLVLSALAIIGAPFVISMTLQDKASLYFEGQVIAREAAESARNHAIAHLEETVYGVEYEAEAEVLDQERPQISYPTGTKASKGPLRKPRSKGRSMVVRKDRGEEAPKKPRAPRNRSGRGDTEEPDEKKGGMPELPDALRLSRKGPSSREVDGLDETAVSDLETVNFPGAGRIITPGGSPAAQFSFRDPGGVTAIATVTDEQGKININTAPPNLIANLFGVGQLARELNPRDTKILLADASMFHGDADARTIDGAIVITDPERGITEAVTYRRKEGEALVDCFRGAYLSLIRDHVFPAGTFVYDLRGWKAAYHKLWARREGGFHPRSLTRFEAIEAIREVSSWQIASFFVARFRGEGLSPEFLRENGIDAKKLTALGLDPYVFPADDAGDDPALKKEYEAARKTLRAAGIKADLVQKLRDARGARVVLELAARLEKADKKTADKVEADLARSLSADARRASRMPREYLKQALTELAEAYETEGLETILPEDLERVRDAITTSSSLPAEWSEAQAVLDDVSITGPEYMARVPRATEFNPGTVIRIRSISDAGVIEFNEAGSNGKQIPAGGFRFGFPVRSSIKGYDGLVQALQRHAVNVNSASRQVLRAVFTGVRGYEDGQVVTPAEADRLAEFVRSHLPIRGHGAFHELIEDAAKSEIIDGNDVLPLMVNAVAPTHNQLRVSTTGLTYSTGDAYTIESRGILRSPAGGELAHAHLREVIEISSGRRLSIGLMTQADMTDGFYFRDPFLAPGYPESHHHHLLGIPGTRSHLVITRPLLIHRALFAVPGGDLSTLRLFPSETEVPARLQRFMLEDIYHFRETYDGLELAHGEAWTLPTSLALGGGQTQPSPTANANATPQDLAMVPGGIEFWLRMRTYPDARDDEGNLILVDAGSDVERNRISLLYADQKGEVKLRIRDSSFRDPSVLRTQDTGQYLEITAKRPLELHTWYQIRIVWDGVFGGGAQLFIDGFPAGTDNLSTELLTAIPEAGQVVAVNVRDASKFPREGVVRIDAELFEYTRGGNTLTIRREPQTSWRPIPHRGNFTGRGREEIEPPEPGKKSAAPRPNLAPDPLLQQAPQVPPQATGPPGSDIMRSPWNRRGFAGSAHQAGAKVILHGYSLPVRRKIRIQQGQQALPGRVPQPQAADERQVQPGDREMVWGRGGLRSVEPLNAFNFPQGVSEIGHYDISAQELGGQANYLVPLFSMVETFGSGFLTPGTLTATIPAGPQPRNAADFFQNRGVCVIGGRAFFFKKEKLPPQYLAAQAQSLAIRKPGQDWGLRILGDYPTGGLQEWNALRKVWDDDRRGIPFIRIFEHGLTHRSLLAGGPIGQVYPPTGILELRGVPTPWEAAYRPNFYGQPAFGKHPDDVVEWIRYAEIYEGSMGGELFTMFVGRLGGTFNFRGYPERHTPGQDDLRKQLDHPAGEPLRLVMELSEGGAGYGDYVTIATNKPSVYEPGMRRVYKVREHQDGRFFVSLLDVGSTGMDIPGSPGGYQRNYLADEEPRLVKFPSWGLPEIPTNSAVLFGEALSAAAGGAGRSNVGGVRQDEDDDPTGITIDEVRRLRNATLDFGTGQVRVPLWFAVVPLDGSSVATRQLADGGQALTGAIPAGRAISRGSPLEVLVVCLSREPQPSIFARGESEGLMRIGDEVFFFEDPAATQGGQAAGAVASTSYTGGAVGPTAQGGQQPQALVDRERDPRERQSMWQRIPAGSAGGFEREGFARLDETQNLEKTRFYEVFYYKQSGFSQCLRGQFGTPIIQDATGGSRIWNVTRRLRLVGRGLLGTERKTHGFGAPAAFIPYFAISSITGPITDSGLPVKRADLFARSHGYLLIDSGEPNVPWEVMAHLGPKGEGMLEVPRDEKGRSMLRACFGTQLRPISNQMFAYELPYRHPDRYEPEREGEALAYLQKSWRIPGAYWREISWVERPSRTLRERKADVVIVARFEGVPDWDAKPTNAPGGLYLFADEDAKEGEPKSFPIDRVADQLEVRIYFRYPSGAFTRLPLNRVTDDWKETPILDSLTVEYEKAGAILRHEELPF